MSEYNEQTNQVTITKYLRARKLEIDYPKRSSPSMRVDREWSVTTGTEETSERADSFIVNFPSDLSETFALRNPLTNEAIPGATMTYQELYVAMFSFGWAMMDIHDNPVIPPEEPPVEEPV